jgi:nitrogen fixation/metabolism regulation signal transduction histidine kinase
LPAESAGCDVVTLSRRLLLYVLAAHLLLAALAAGLWWVSPWLTLAAEAVFAITLTWGLLLVRRAGSPLDQSRTALELIRSREFTTRLLPTGAPEVDTLVEAYNELSSDLRAERVRLQEQQWFLEKIVAASPAGIVTFDLDGRVLSANAAAVRLAGHLVPGTALSSLPAPLGEALAGIAPGESRLVPDGARRRLLCRMSEFFEQGFSRRFLLIEELTEELHQSERAAYAKLIRVMAHEINNSVGAGNSLLASCRAYGAQLAPGDREEFERALALAIARGEHLNAFLNRFADVVRLPAPRRAPTDLAALVRSAVLFMQAAAPRGVAWQVQVPDRGPMIEADAYQLEQVLINVLKNALDAVGQSGTIAITLEAAATPDGPARLVIADDGPGIPEAARQELFSPFFTTKPGGQGIGLTMAREILTAHGYPFGLENEPGRGARFWIDCL